METIDYIAMIVGYITICSFTGIALFVLLYILYWCVLIPLHYSCTFYVAYRRHKNATVWTEDYLNMKLKILTPWFRAMKKPFALHNTCVEGSLLTIDYRCRIPNVTIAK